MPAFQAEGSDKDHFWLIDGSRDFAIMPAIQNFPSLPIRLHVGDPDFGEVHLYKHRLKWPPWMRKLSGAEILHHKLKTSGDIYTTEGEKKKKVALYVKPSALLVVQYRYLRIENRQEHYWSVISLHPRSTPLDGEVIGRYQA